MYLSEPYLEILVRAKLLSPGNWWYLKFLIVLEPEDQVVSVTLTFKSEADEFLSSIREALSDLS